MFSSQRLIATEGLEHNPNGRIASMPDAETKIAESVESSVAETWHCGIDPVILRFHAALMRIQTSELERLYHRLPELDDRSRQEIGQFADCLVATVLHRPLESLRDHSCHDSTRGLLDALQRLFQLND